MLLIFKLKDASVKMQDVFWKFANLQQTACSTGDYF